MTGGAWVAQLVERLTPAQVMILQLTSLSPMSGSVLTARAWTLLRILRLPLSLPLPCSHPVSPSLKNKQALKKFSKLISDKSLIHTQNHLTLKDYSLNYLIVPLINSNKNMKQSEEIK